MFHKDVKSLFANSEFLSINCPANSETTKIVNEDTLKHLLPNCVVANSARGDIVDDEAMIKALKSKKFLHMVWTFIMGNQKFTLNILS